MTTLEHEERADLVAAVNNAIIRAEAAERSLAAEENLRAHIERQFEEFKARATSILHQEADNRRFCSEFDDVMERIGLPRRSFKYEVTFEVIGRIRVEVEAIDEDTAWTVAAESLPYVRDNAYTLIAGDQHHNLGVSEINNEDIRRVDNPF